MSKITRGRQPDYRLLYLNKSTEETGHIGAAWITKTGISIKLNACVVIRATPDTVLTLFPIEQRQSSNPLAPGAITPEPPGRPF